MPQQFWTYEQDLAVLYGKLTHGLAFRQHPDVQRLAEAMGRTHAALCMRKGNFDSLDPRMEGVGLSNAAALTRTVWDEYTRNPEDMLVRAKAAYTGLLSS